MTELTFTQGLIVAAGGALGALAKDVLVDNTLELPYKKDGKLFLGFLGASIVGAFIGYLVDGSFITALLAGYAGKSVLENLLADGFKRKEP